LKILNISIDIENLKNNQQRLLDLNKSILYELDNNIFDKIDFEADSLYLEPSLFYFLLSEEKEKHVSLKQILRDAFLSAPAESIDLYFDQNGNSFICGIGEYFSSKIKDETVTGTFAPTTKSFCVNNNCLPVRAFLYPEATNKIKSPRYLPEILFSVGCNLEEPIMETYDKAAYEFNKAIHFFKKHLPDFFETIEIVTKEIFIFNSKNFNSFAGITYHGAAFLNTEGKEQDYIFFIEDIAHQCGHIIFNTLTMDYDDYINVPKETQLQEIDMKSIDKRKVYGAYHGLFTYSCIMYSLSKCLDLIEDHNRMFLLLGRIGFFLTKFSMDVQFFAGNSHIFQAKGLILLQQFREYYDHLYVSYYERVKDFDYTNQPYTFDETSFLVKNKAITQ
jgi:hypothetical protein